MFKDRTDAGQQLAVLLRKFRNEDGILLAVPKGGVPVAYEIVKDLGFPLDLALVKKIGHPQNREYAIGAVSLHDYFVTPHEKVSREYILQQVSEIRQKLKIMQQSFKKDEEPLSLNGKTLIVVDDGIATGNTLLGIIQVLKKSQPAKIIVAAPVASKKAVHLLSKAADEIICIRIPEPFFGVGAFYRDFEQVRDEDVSYYLGKIKEHRLTG